MIYLDNAATSYPKPAAVLTAMTHFARKKAASPGRSCHRMSIETSRTVFEARSKAARLIGAPDPRQVLFTSGATESINVALQGWLRPGDHVVTTRMEHNAVMRILDHLAGERGIRVGFLPQAPDGFIDPSDLRKTIRKKTRLIVLNHASNVTGAVVPVEEIAAEAGDLPVLVDAAQSAGILPIDVGRTGIAMLAFSGHKGLMGPPGTGILYLREDVAGDLRPLKFGGTGSRSEETRQPDFLPDRFEAGTPNVYGIAGLSAALDFILKRSIEAVGSVHARHRRRLVGLLSGIEGIGLQLPRTPGPCVPNVSLTFDRLSPSEAAALLDRRYAVGCRAGLHCCPAAHKLMGTFPQGTIRLSPGYFTTPGQAAAAAAAVKALARGRSGRR
jgi:cysteine desulfurase/selenocysteine lyase